jgi:hypothetical protein
MSFFFHILFQVILVDCIIQARHWRCSSLFSCPCCVFSHENLNYISSECSDTRISNPFPLLGQWNEVQNIWPCWVVEVNAVWYPLGATVISSKLSLLYDMHTSWILGLYPLKLRTLISITEQNHMIFMCYHVLFYTLILLHVTHFRLWFPWPNPLEHTLSLHAS